MIHDDKVRVQPFTYIRLAEGRVAKTEDRDNLLLDLAEDGTVLGIELMTRGTMCGCWGGSE